MHFLDVVLKTFPVKQVSQVSASEHSTQPSTQPARRKPAARLLSRQCSKSFETFKPDSEVVNKLNFLPYKIYCFDETQVIVNKGIYLSRLHQQGKTCYHRCHICLYQSHHLHMRHSYSGKLEVREPG